VNPTGSKNFEGFFCDTAKPEKSFFMFLALQSLCKRLEIFACR
jgi:hypothetical protein